MIDNYRGIAVFHAVAEAGSFSGAAKNLKLSTSVVSHHVSKLEAKLGAPLFFRSTRSLSLTHEGEKIRDAARRMVEAGDAAVDLLTDEIDQPVGTLRIATPAFGIEETVQKKFWDFAHRYPKVSLIISSSDKQVNLIEEGFDLAIRLGKLSDSSLKYRKLGTFDRITVASPDYLDSRPPIETIDDLKQCDFLSFTMVSDEITLVRNDERVSFIPERCRLEVDTIASAKSAITQGLGLQRLPVSSVVHELQLGVLVKVLPEWQPPSLGIYAVWSDSGSQKKLARLLIDHLVA